MYTYTSRGNRYLGPILLAISLVLALTLVSLGVMNTGILRHSFFAAALLVAAVGTALVVRLQLPEYRYEISDAEIPGQYDLCITSAVGKRRKTDCRVRVSGTVMSYPRKKRGLPPKILCCRLFPGEKRFLFLPEEAENRYCLIFCPNEEMLAIMQSLGVKKEE